MSQCLSAFYFFEYEHYKGIKSLTQILRAMHILKGHNYKSLWLNLQPLTYHKYSSTLINRKHLYKICKYFISMLDINVYLYYVKVFFFKWYFLFCFPSFNANNSSK